jgi:DNA replication and repair protein RecF
VWLTEIEADRLRNLKAVQLGLPAGLTLVAGRNGQGKSSLLEAVYLLGTGRSFRTRRTEELIAWGGGPLRVSGGLTSRLGRGKLTVVLDGERRGLLVDGAEQDLESFIGRLDVVDLTGERMKVLRGGPDERRRFLDRGIVGLEPSYLRAIAECRRVLQQRNALLRSGQYRGIESVSAELDVWDERLVRAAKEVHRRRREYALELSAGLGEAGRALFQQGEELRLHYRPSPAAAGDEAPDRFAESYRARLSESRGRDLSLGHTAEGPHRDDLLVKLGKIDLRRFGSAGQVRASMIALKLSKLCIVQKARGEAPLFLMDDFDSDLDETRVGALAAFLQDGGFQALVATSKEALADRLEVTFMKVRMDDGRALPA